MFGVTLLSTCLFAHFTKNSRDAVIKTTILWGRVIGLSIYILTRCHSYFTVTGSSTCKWNEKALYFGIYGDCLWFLGNLVYAVKSSFQGERAKILYGRLEGHLVTDFIFTFLFALSFYVFPGHMLGFQAKIKLDKMHASITRLMAAILFNSTFIAGSSSRFTSKDDKLAFLLSRIIGITGYILSQIYAQLTTDNWTHWHVYFGMLGMTVWLVNAVAGYMYGRQKEQTHTE
ncbi:hypothetical protein FSP39_021467 [Pinctada imbricata]|uniref:Uncharacterized protein n=1 Tax=Pinctada imbricata TaxID=66713 RepID=A0AA88XVS2_PINIB|nr:hypothetical protein FSP39_021467 [Pinctada imbricata]